MSRLARWSRSAGSDQQEQAGKHTSTASRQRSYSIETEELCYGYACDVNCAREDADLTVWQGVWNLLQYSGLVWSEFIQVGQRHIRLLWAGTRSCGPEPPVYDYRGRGAPSYSTDPSRSIHRSCHGSIHRSCHAPHRYL